MRSLSLVHLLVIAGCAVGATTLGSCRSAEEVSSDHVARADAYSSEGKPDAALLELRQALQTNPASAEVCHRLAELLRSQGELADAAFFYHEATRLDPERVTDSLALAELARVADPEGALALIEAVLEREPGNIAALRFASELDIAAGRREGAIARVDTALAGSPANPEPLQLLRVLLVLDSGDAAAAERGLVALVEGEKPFGPAVPKLVALYASQGRIDEAIDTLQARSGDTLSRRLLLAHLHLRRGDQTEARQFLEEALAERSDLPNAKNDLAYILASQGQELGRALQLAREAYRVLDDDPAAADTLGLVFLHKGLHEAAASQFDLAVELADDTGRPDPLLHYHQGLSLAALGRHDEASSAFQTALALDPNRAGRFGAPRSDGLTARGADGRSRPLVGDERRCRS
jgi:tetratricopeptide (TPR) repeat protein